MQVIEVHPDNPQPRLVAQVAKVLEQGGIVVYPTLAGYAVGCDAHNKKAVNKLYSIKKPLKKYVMALMFQNFSDITEYAKVDNKAFKIMKNRTPGPYTFILPAQVHIVRKLNVKRQEIGVRMPQHPFLVELHKHFTNPLLNTAARIQEDEDYTNAWQLTDVFQGKADLLVDCGEIQINPTNIIDLTSGEPEVIRGEL